MDRLEIAVRLMAGFAPKIKIGKNSDIYWMEAFSIADRMIAGDAYSKELGEKTIYDPKEKKFVTTYDVVNIELGITDYLK